MHMDATVVSVKGTTLKVLANGVPMTFTVQNVQLVGALLPGDSIRILFVTEGATNLATDVQPLR